MTVSIQSTPRNDSPADRKFVVLLLAHGTPETVDEIPQYLKNVVSGRPLPQQVIEEIQHRYTQIGKSPLTEWTYRQAALLQKRISLSVYVGMRNWKPYIADTVREMRNDGVTDAVAICLAPQNSRTSVGLYRRAAYAEAGGAIRFRFIESWADNPCLADAFADRLRTAWSFACRVAGRNVPVLFTAHSVPCRTIQTHAPSTDELHSDQRDDTHKSGPVRPTAPERSYAIAGSSSAGPDPYAQEAKRTALLVAKRLASEGLTDRDWHFAFQSQGMSGGPWIGPTVEDTLAAIQQEGHTAVVVQPIGFLCDHVEILYDIDIGFKELTRKVGMQLFRPESLNDSPLLIDALTDLVRRGLDDLHEVSPNATLSAQP